MPVFCPQIWKENNKGLLKFSCDHEPNNKKVTSQVFDKEVQQTWFFLHWRTQLGYFLQTTKKLSRDKKIDKKLLCLIGSLCVCCGYCKGEKVVRQKRFELSKTFFLLMKKVQRSSSMNFYLPIWNKNYFQRFLKTRT